MSLRGGAALTALLLTRRPGIRHDVDQCDQIPRLGKPDPGKQQQRKTGRSRPILLLEARASKTSGRIVLLGKISITEVERATKDADGIVVCLLAPGLAIRNGDELGIAHLMEEMHPKRGTQHTVQHSPAGADGRCRKVVTK
jgi:hypothetical protein